MNVRVDWRASVSLVGTVVKFLAVAMVVPIVVAIVYGGDGLATFVAAAAVAVGIGSALERLDDDPEIGSREGFLMVALSWLFVSFVGAVPYLVEGWLPVLTGTATAPSSTLANPVNALFESMSGFTTTGATVMGSIAFEHHSRALMMWRQLTQWLGGMGIVVLAVAILPELSVGGAQLMDAEAPGPGIEKLTPRIAETARVLWLAYVGITAVEILLLYSLSPAILGLDDQMTFYNAVAHGFTTMSTGGFSPEARSIEAFSAVTQWVFVPFMIAAGTNFTLFWSALNGDLRKFLADTEFKAYTGILGVLTAVVAGLLFVDGGLAAPGPVYDGVNPSFVAVTFPIAGAVEPALRQAAFQVAALVTSTGYASMDFNAWSGPARLVLVFAMFIGGSAGSTGGGIKIIRWVVILKSIRRELFTTVHPEAVSPVRLAGRPLDERTLRGIYAFTLLYFAIFLSGALFLAADAALTAHVTGNEAYAEAVTPIVALTASAATIGNIGPGLGAVGPMNSYLFFSPQSKLLMILFMWIGRLEILPVLVLLTRGYWRS